MDDFTSGVLDFGYYEIRHEIHYNTTATQLFTALTGDLSNWWGAPYLVRANSTGMQLEPRLGGSMYESWHGGGALWGEVNELTENEMLELQGPLGFSFPTRCKLRIELHQHQRGTRLRFLLQIYGNISAEQHMEFDDAWLELLGERLKAYVERGEKRGIGHEKLPWGDLPPLPPPPED
jgi:uncharacterized protein YndB with AHSA1/START domain